MRYKELLVSCPHNISKDYVAAVYFSQQEDHSSMFSPELTNRLERGHIALFLNLLRTTIPLSSYGI